MRRIRSLVLAAALAQAVAVAPARAEEGLSTLMDHGRLRQAATVAETRLRTGPDDVEALRVLALIRATERRFDEARKLGEKAVAAAPQDPDAHYALALACGREVQSASTLRKPGLASRFKKEAEAALALDPDHEKATEGMIEFYQGRRGSWAATRRRRTRWPTA
jgi:Tfp pilus assembly protein PilF